MKRLLFRWFNIFGAPAFIVLLIWGCAFPFSVMIGMFIHYASLTNVDAMFLAQIYTDMLSSPEPEILIGCIVLYFLFLYWWYPQGKKMADKQDKIFFGEE